MLQALRPRERPSDGGVVGRAFLSVAYQSGSGPMKKELWGRVLPVVKGWSRPKPDDDWMDFVRLAATEQILSHP